MATVFQKLSIENGFDSKYLETGAFNVYIIQHRSRYVMYERTLFMTLEIKIQLYAPSDNV